MSIEVFADEPENERPDVRIDSPITMRPDLSPLGIDEVERGICEDSYTNRAILRRSKMGWDPVYASNGVPTGLIQARSPEMDRARRVISLTEKKPILVDPDILNSDYLTGYDLLAEEAADYLVPPWVVAATRNYLKEQENGGPSSPRRKPAALPTRCKAVKDDGIRCMMWSSGRIKDDGYCRVHLGSIARKPGEDIERARAKLTQAAPYAVDVLEELMDGAQSEPVRLKASTEILDRAGVRGGLELSAHLEVTDGRSPAEIVQDRLSRLAQGAIEVAARLAQDGIGLPEGSDETSDDTSEQENQ